jgi:hypothetical protein
MVPVEEPERTSSQESPRLAVSTSSVVAAAEVVAAVVGAVVVAASGDVVVAGAAAVVVGVAVAVWVGAMVSDVGRVGCAGAAFFLVRSVTASVAAGEVVSAAVDASGAAVLVLCR